MPIIPLSLPSLPTWAQQLANILPLTVLIEFTEVAAKLHCYHLNGSVPLWNWPITPQGARLVLSKENGSASACCLDHPERSKKTLECIDGRYADRYFSAAPTTVRTCADVLKPETEVYNESENLKSGNARYQRLDVIHIGLPPPRNARQSRRSAASYFTKRAVVCTLGYGLWALATVLSFTFALYTAGAYLVVVTLTGLAISALHGSPPRTLDLVPAKHSRLVIAASDMNASSWLAFYGNSRTLTSLLNRSLYSPPRIGFRAPIIWIARLLIAGQWILAIASCCTQDWDAFVIALWIVICALTTEILYTPSDAMADWLKRDGGIRATKIRATFSSRRAMMGAMAFLNPDKDQLEWMDPILRDTGSRKEWKKALVEYLYRGRCEDERMKDKFEYTWIVESGAVGRRLKGEIESLEQDVRRGNTVP